MMSVLSRTVIIIPRNRGYIRGLPTAVIKRINSSNANDQAGSSRLMYCRRDGSKIDSFKLEFNGGQEDKRTNAKAHGCSQDQRERDIIFLTLC
jgi:hypothetical protein